MKNQQVEKCQICGSPIDEELNHYRLKADRFLCGGLNCRLKENAPERRWFLPQSAFGGLKKFGK